MKYTINQIQNFCEEYNSNVDSAFKKMESLIERYIELDEKYNKEFGDDTMKYAESYNDDTESHFHSVFDEFNNTSYASEYLIADEIFNEYQEALEHNNEEEIEGIESYINNMITNMQLKIGEDNKIGYFNNDNSFTEYLNSLELDLQELLKEKEKFVEELSSEIEFLTKAMSTYEYFLSQQQKYYPCSSSNINDDIYYLGMKEWKESFSGSTRDFLTLEVYAVLKPDSSYMNDKKKYSDELLKFRDSIAEYVEQERQADKQALEVLEEIEEEHELKYDLEDLINELKSELEFEDYQSKITIRAYILRNYIKLEA